jgi:hypothetical protein
MPVVVLSHAPSRLLPLCLTPLGVHVRFMDHFHLSSTCCPAFVQHGTIHFIVVQRQPHLSDTLRRHRPGTCMWKLCVSLKEAACMDCAIAQHQVVRHC